MKKSLNNVAPWLVLAMLVLAGVNILAKLVNYPIVILDSILVVLGFAVLLVLVYSMNGFKFKSLLDLGIFTLIIAALGWMAMNSASLVPMGLVATIFSGLAPLMAGLVVAGIISVIMGLVNIKSVKRK